jgi:serine/threonine-protein kinase
VAVKLLHAHLRANPDVLRRFRQEGMLAAKLTDPSIVAVYDTVSTPDTDAIVMELVSGETLRQRLDRRGRVDPATVVDIGCRVADALEVAHRNGLIHRDIKPANILLCEDGTVKVADFGIAKDGDLEDLTRDGTLVGTASYVAPEQLTGASVDGRADLYSLGVVLYEAVCGRAPFTGDTEAARAMQRLHQTPVPAHRVVPGVPRGLSHCLSRLLERDPDRRPESAGELRAELADCLEPTAPGLSTAEMNTVRRAPGRRQAKAPRPVRRSRLGMGILIVLIGAAVALIIGLVSGGQGDNDTADQSTPTTLASPVAIPIAGVTAFDPQGTGQPGENDGLVGQAYDDNPATSWHTEQYNQRDFGTKSGVGLIIHLAHPTPLRDLDVSSPTHGWSAGVFVSNGVPTTAPTTGAAASLTNIAGNGHFALGGAVGSTILLWITDLGSGPPRYQVSISELKVHGGA